MRSATDPSTQPMMRTPMIEVMSVDGMNGEEKPAERCVHSDRGPFPTQRMP